MYICCYYLVYRESYLERNIKYLTWEQLIVHLFMYTFKIFENSLILTEISSMHISQIILLCNYLWSCDTEKWIIDIFNIDR